MTVRILAAGDQFVRTDLLADALHQELGNDIDVSTLELQWPVEPFGRIAEVDEASGSEEQMIEALQDVRICVTQMAPLTERILAACPDLELFAVGRGGPVNANIEAAARHGVTVTCAPGRNAVATSEHTVAMMMAAARRIPNTHSELMGGVWRGDYYQYDQVGVELEGSCVGLVGYGAIGKRVARILKGFGATVLVYDPYIRADAVTDVDELVGLDELLNRSQVVSLHARLTKDNAGMIGTKEIAAMPSGSIIVNCARGGLLDYDAVCDALESGHLFGAAFDVFPEEPIPVGSRLLATPGIVMTPHLACGFVRLVAGFLQRSVAVLLPRSRRTGCR
ncbi:2-hydroxyacid dehydrogenase [Hoyosella altamirensis]|uniref:D-3-phosphoglycerate dehydrogenase n=1 Tax=Hoyosella altamirensis TaxID=616997 RepID=A0A839RK89_9ACTN|nr:2-hydroxyacid dehydrogenase [Hoyosella altamirensis]MBB3036536.1 D-3-phosphoglycerate dehydrogenase [Hoyosella altamirensis]